MKAATLQKFCLSALAFLFLAVLTTPALADGDDPPSLVARVSYLSGNVSFEPSGENQFSQASINYPLTTGDRIYTEQGGRVELETGNIAVRVSGNTDITTTNLTDNLLQFGLSQGTARFRAYNLPSGQSIEIDTPNAAFTILRAGNYRFETYPDSDTTFVTVTSGDLEISGAGNSQTVHSGQAVRLTGANPAQIEWVSIPAGDDFDRWCGDRDRRFTAARSLQYVSHGVPGYADLDDYGRWEPVPQYGQVWYPVAVPVGWVPYRYGHWAWVEPWGWTWIEDEPWGFAPFHYGRWVFVGSRWGWVPAPPVAPVPCYAPALVAFVGGGGFSVSLRFGGGVQAWFPLGPEEPFYPWYHHSPVYLRQVNVTNVRNVTNITNVINVRTTNVTNITYVNQRVATTAVPSEAFRSSQPVAHQMVALKADEIARAQVIAHPQIHPDARAITGGMAQTHPPIQVVRPAVAERIGVSQTSVKSGPDNNRVIERNTHTIPKTLGDVSGNPSQGSTTDYRKFEHRNLDKTPRNSRALITKTPPPLPNPSFEVRRNAMEPHPGRPLEPQQVQNLRQGRPAGPMHDEEFHHHDRITGKHAEEHTKDRDKTR